MNDPPLRPGRPGGKRDQNRKRRREQIASAAQPLFVEHGVDVTTIDQIVAAAGVAKGSFYRYFEDKDDLVRVMFDPLYQAVAAALDRCGAAVRGARKLADFSAAHEALAAELAPHIANNPALVRIYLQESRGPAHGARVAIAELSRAVAQRAIELAERGHQSDVFRADVPPAVSALAVVGAIERLAAWYLDHPEQLEATPAELGRGLVALMMEGMVAKPRGRLF